MPSALCVLSLSFAGDTLLFLLDRLLEESCLFVGVAGLGMGKLGHGLLPSYWGALYSETVWNRIVK